MVPSFKFLLNMSNGEEDRKSPDLPRTYTRPFAPPYNKNDDECKTKTKACYAA